MNTKKNITIRCPQCKIPFLKIYFNGKQSYLKWFGGKMNEVFCWGIYEIRCFKCGEKIEILREIMRALDKDF